MSRGPGRIEMAVAAAFISHHDRAFTVAELASIAYPDAAAVEKRHRVSVLRAADRVASVTGWSKTVAGTPRQAVYVRGGAADPAEAAGGASLRPDRAHRRQKVDPAIAEAVAGNVIAFLRSVLDPPGVATFVAELDRTTVDHLRRRL